MELVRLLFTADQSTTEHLETILVYGGVALLVLFNAFWVVPPLAREGLAWLGTALDRTEVIAAPDRPLVITSAQPASFSTPAVKGFQRPPAVVVDLGEERERRRLIAAALSSNTERPSPIVPRQELA